MKKFLSILLVVMLVLSMIPATVSAAGTEKTYVKVTENLADWSGDYLIVYETNNCVFDGSLATLDAVSNFKAVTISGGKITCSSDFQFTIEKIDGGYSIQSASGKYIGRTATSNGLNAGDSPYVNQITFSNGAVSITSSGGPKLQFNSDSGQTRFRYFKTTQKAICLYKLEEGPAPCDHSEEKLRLQSVQQNPTCEAVGYKAIYICQCGKQLGGEEIPVIDHVYVDGECTMCHQAEPDGYARVTSLQTVLDGGQFVIAVEYNGTYYALGTTIDDTMTAQVVDVDNDLVVDANAPVWTIEKTGENTVSLSNGNRYLGFSSKDLVDSGTAYSWTVSQQGENIGFRFMEAGNARGIAYNYNSGNPRFKAYAASNFTNSNYRGDLILYKVSTEEAAGYMGSDRNVYDTVEAALEAGVYTVEPVNGAEIPETVTVTLNENNKNATYKFAVLPLEDDVYTYYSLDIRTVNIRSKDDGMYFSTNVKCDPALAAQVESCGVVMSLNSLTENMDKDAYAYTTTEVEDGLDISRPIVSAGVFHIFKNGANNEERGGTDVHAKAYLKLKGDGTILTSVDEVSLSFLGALGTLNDQLGSGKLTLTEAQQTDLQSFGQRWSGLLSEKGLTNIPGVQAN